MSEWELDVDDIIVHPYRQDLGDLTELAVSIAQAGMVRPIVITSGGVLLSGARRLRAARELGIKRVPVFTAESLPMAEEALVADLAETEGQIPMDARARVVLGRALEDLPRPPGTGDVRDRVAKSLGLGAHTWTSLKRIAEAVEQGELEPEVYDDIDRDGSPSPTLKMLEAQRAGTLGEQEEEAKEPKRFELTTERQRQVAEKARMRFATALGGLDGYRSGLDDLDLQRVLAVADPSEVEEWMRILNKTTRTLRTVRTALEKGAVQ